MHRGIRTRLAVMILLIRRNIVSSENLPKTGLTVSGQSIRKLSLRFRFRKTPGALMAVTLSATAALTVLNWNAMLADDRQRWMANVPENNWQYIVIHHSATESGSVKSIHKEHRLRIDAEGNPWLGIGYHFVIGNGDGMKDGLVEPTFRWNEQIHGAHSGHAVFNARGIGICLVGNFENTPPTKAQLKSVRELVQVLAVRHGIPRENLLGHAAVKATACPGKLCPLKEIRRVIPERSS